MMPGEETFDILSSEIFWELHRGLPRQGPGDNPFTRRALRAAGPLPPEPVVVDLGCGPGMQTRELARVLGSRVIGIDNHAPFLAELKALSEQEGIGDLVETREADMAELPFEPGSIDLIWSEGALYILGFKRGLTLWRPLLRPRGAVAVTEAAWLKPGAPAEIRQYWDQGYPAMVSREENVGKAERCGYRVLEHFALPAEAWWTHYYTPIESRLPEFRRRYAGNREAEAVLDAEALEIDLFRKYHDYYGYVFYVLRWED
jgi:SAM-dependent methyltransferase